MARPVLPATEKRFMYPADDHLLPFRDQMTPAQEAALRREFGTYLGVPTHPALVAARMIDWMCATFLPTMPLVEARRFCLRLGMLEWRRQSILGRVMTAAMPLMGMERVMPRIPGNMSTLSNFGTRWVAPLGPRHWVLAVEDDALPPECLAGILDAFSEFTRVRGLAVSWTSPGPLQAVYDISWEA
jgi:uncharacterized protein (TIGR02265 family)